MVRRRRPVPDGTFASMLRDAMFARDYSAKRLAYETGLDVNTVNAYMSGMRVPTYGSLRKIRDALDCEWDELLG